MRVLMFLRDPLPPLRADVRTLFGRCLRAQGIETMYAGHIDTARAEGELPPVDCIDLGERRALRAIWRAVRLVWSRRRQTEMVIVRDQPLLGALLLATACCARLPRVYWMSFPIPLGDRVAASMHRADGRPWRARLVTLRGHLAAWIERVITLRLAQHVFVQSNQMRRSLMALLPSLASRTTAVPMGVDELALSNLPSCNVPLQEGPWVGYLGSLDRARQLDVLLHALVHLHASVPRARLLLIGSAPRAADLAWLFDTAERLGIRDRVQHVDALPIRQAWTLLQRVDVAVSPIPSGPLYDVSSPTKVVEYLALGVPVVATDIPDQRDLLAHCGGGVCVPFTAEALARGISGLLASPLQSRQQAARAAPLALAARSYSVLAAPVGARLRELASAYASPSAAS